MGEPPDKTIEALGDKTKRLAQWKTRPWEIRVGVFSEAQASNFGMSSFYMKTLIHPEKSLDGCHEIPLILSCFGLFAPMRNIPTPLGAIRARPGRSGWQT
jgi:hypothetical protein